MHVRVASVPEACVQVPEGAPAANPAPFISAVATEAAPTGQGWL